MKIKEKGLSGKAAQIKRETISTNTRKFNAFRNMASASKEKEKEKEKAKPPKEIYLEFMGTKIKVHTEDGVGTVKDEDIPYVKGASMKFEGCGGELSFADIKVRLHSSFQFFRITDVLDNRVHYVHDSSVHLSSSGPKGMILG